jgi:undecaprenyl pyrophosphate phosphatase UppP
MLNSEIWHKRATWCIIALIPAFTLGSIFLIFYSLQLVSIFLISLGWLMSIGGNICIIMRDRNEREEKEIIRKLTRYGY